MVPFSDHYRSRQSLKKSNKYPNRHFESEHPLPVRTIPINNISHPPRNTKTLKSHPHPTPNIFYITLIRSAHILSITTSLFLSDFSFAATFYTLPALSHSPLPARVKGWLSVYDLGKLVAPRLSIASSLAWSYLSYASYMRKSEVGASGQGYAAAPS